MEAKTLKFSGPRTRDKDGDEGGECIISTTIQNVSNGYIVTYYYSDDTEVTEVYNDVRMLFATLSEEFGLED